ncbi:MAG: hypothetical protein AB1679_36600, partial [Actinomycetota bacterium]
MNRGMAKTLLASVPVVILSLGAAVAWAEGPVPGLPSLPGAPAVPAPPALPALPGASAVPALPD